MHPILTTRPGWEDIAVRKAKLERAQAVHTQRQVAASDKYRAEKAAWDEQLRTQMLEGSLPTMDPPEPPKPSGDPGVFIAEHQRLAAEERSWLARHADRLEQMLTERHSEVMAEAAALVAGLADCASELSDLNATVAHVRAAADDGRPVAPGRIDPAAVVRAVESGCGFLTPPRHNTTTTTTGMGWS